MMVCVCGQRGGGGEDRPRPHEPVHPVLQGEDRAHRTDQRRAAL